MSKVMWPLFLFTFFWLFGQERVDIKLTQEEKEWINLIKEEEIEMHLDNDLGILNYHTEDVNGSISPEVINTLEGVSDLNFKVIKQKKKEEGQMTWEGMEEKKKKESGPGELG